MVWRHLAPEWVVELVFQSVAGFVAAPMSRAELPWSTVLAPSEFLVKMDRQGDEIGDFTADE